MIKEIYVYILTCTFFELNLYNKFVKCDDNDDDVDDFFFLFYAKSIRLFLFVLFFLIDRMNF